MLKKKHIQNNLKLFDYQLIGNFDTYIYPAHNHIKIQFYSTVSFGVREQSKYSRELLANYLFIPTSFVMA